jgi:hypothetical protein
MRWPLDAVLRCWNIRGHGIPKMASKRKINESVAGIARPECTRIKPAMTT